MYRYLNHDRALFWSVKGFESYPTAQTGWAPDIFASYPKNAATSWVQPGWVMTMESGQGRDSAWWWLSIVTSVVRLRTKLEMRIRLFLAWKRGQLSYRFPSAFAGDQKSFGGEKNCPAVSRSASHSMSLQKTRNFFTSRPVTGSWTVPGSPWFCMKKELKFLLYGGRGEGTNDPQ